MQQTSESKCVENWMNSVHIVSSLVAICSCILFVDFNVFFVKTEGANSHKQKSQKCRMEKNYQLCITKNLHNAVFCIFANTNICIGRGHLVCKYSLLNNCISQATYPSYSAHWCLCSLSGYHIWSCCDFITVFKYGHKRYILCAKADLLDSFMDLQETEL